MKPILEIQNISKKFRINHEQQPYLSLRDSLTNIFKNKSSKEDFWALKDVSFDVMPGDTVGIIGKNGAGKSTLLKILSKITPPTTGKIISRGRIASLLEVGTGFHPELSGRENVFMNGSILGMRRAEILKNFDAIIDFAGVEKFIDTPLKHYSSGMQLRLAFAVAAFLENEILIIDEVLAVGDAEFQKKCMGKMGEVSKSGRTILFVSHQLSALEHVCKQGLILNKGHFFFKGDINTATKMYIESFNKTVKEKQKVQNLISNISLQSMSGNYSIFPLDIIKIQFALNLPYSIENATLGIVVSNIFNINIIGINNKNYGIQTSLSKNKNNVEIILHNPPLLPGQYNLDIYVGDGVRDHFSFLQIYNFTISDKNILKSGKMPDVKINSFIIEKTEWNVF